jgi:hypothetical protein
MCRKCNEALLAAATAANLLAEASATLYNINQQEAANTLANAAADLFKPAEETQAPGAPGTASKNEGSVDPMAAARAEINAQLPEGMTIGDDDLVYLNGKAIGEAMIIRRPTKH